MIFFFLLQSFGFTTYDAECFYYVTINFSTLQAGFLKFQLDKSNCTIYSNSTLKQYKLQKGFL